MDTKNNTNGYMVPQDTPVLQRLRGDAAELAKECTRDPLFHLEEKTYTLVYCPDWLASDGDGFWFDTYDMDHPNVLEMMTDGEIDETKVYEWICDHDWDGVVGAIQGWMPVTAFLTREEAEEFAKSTSYRYKHGWRVYCRPAEGALAELLSVARYRDSP